ncbi:hypothetical protein J6590_070595 [Homalodisca vitripennis]|nr:hypothetical protein J6590_070595 [Homalodisca vitripennis]
MNALRTSFIPLSKSSFRIPVTGTPEVPQSQSLALGAGAMLRITRRIVKPRHKAASLRLASALLFSTLTQSRQLHSTPNPFLFHTGTFTEQYKHQFLLNRCGNFS